MKGFFKIPLHVLCILEAYIDKVSQLFQLCIIGLRDGCVNEFSVLLSDQIPLHSPVLHRVLDPIGAAELNRLIAEALSRAVLCAGVHFQGSG